MRCLNVADIVTIDAVQPLILTPAHQLEQSSGLMWIQVPTGPHVWCVNKWATSDDGKIKNCGDAVLLTTQTSTSQHIIG